MLAPLIIILIFIVICICFVVIYIIKKRTKRNKKSNNNNQISYAYSKPDAKLSANAQKPTIDINNAKFSKTEQKEEFPFQITHDTFKDYISAGIQQALEYERNSPNPKFHRTELEKELSSRFFSDNFHTVIEYEKRISNNSLRIKNATIDEQLEMARSEINAYNELKEYCYKTKGGAIYFQNMWEHCHNSKNPDFDFVDEIKDNYAFLTKNYDTLVNLDSIIIQTIYSNPGLLQKNIYKLINVELKYIIQCKIRELEAENKIKRTKKSGSYLLELQDSEASNINIIFQKPINNEQLSVIDIPKTIKFDEIHTTELTAGLKIPDEVINLLWIKGGPLDNFVPDKSNNHNSNIFGINFNAASSIEPSLIDTSLPLDLDICDNDFMTDIGYYPSYERLTPKQRYIYISWLQDISKPVAMGYVFIFYYGLERHLLFGKYREAIKMIQYLQQFHKNKSFYGYSTDAMLIGILKHQDLELMKDVNWDNANTRLYALIKGALRNGYSTEDIIKLYKDFGFTNNRYIKNQYDDFYTAVMDVLVNKFGSDFYPLSPDTLKNCTENQILIVANYSLMYENRLAIAPDITSNLKLRNDIYDILHKAHETVKLNNRQNKKT